MDTIFTSFKNSEIFDLHRLIFNLTIKILKRGDKRGDKTVALSNS